MEKQVFNVHRHSMVKKISKMYLSCTTKALYLFPLLLLILLKTLFHMVENSTSNSYQEGMIKLGSFQISKSQEKL